MGVQLPIAMLSRLPMSIALPSVAAPRRKIDPKYDVTMIGRRNVGKGLDFYSLDREAALGKQLATEVESSVRLLKDPVITEYINRLGQRLVRNSDAQVPFTIKVIDDDEVNAFALPGGYFYVNTGLIMAADNEAGLAGVMAHEIAHVAARHATKNQTRSQIFDLISIPLVFVGGPAVMAARQVMGIAVPLGFLKFSRDAEREADMLGMQYEYATGYDPQEFVKLFEKLKAVDKQKKNFLSRAFATHPMTDDRIKRAQKMIGEYLPDRNEYVVDTSEFQQVRARLAELMDRRKIDLGKVTPVLRRRVPATEPKPSEDGPPTLRRH
ncbi:MAG TPA: M48 family metallopeptidase [Terriglobales bacterium]|nr:M48 family metallopeptidase [Terriglobales bacterium]